MGAAPSRPSSSTSPTTVTPISSPHPSLSATPTHSSNSNSHSSSPQSSTTSKSTTRSTPRLSSSNSPLPRLERVFATIHTPPLIREHEARLRERHLEKERKRKEIVNALVIEQETPSPIEGTRVGFPYYEEAFRGVEVGKKKSRGRGGRWGIRI